MLVRRHVHQFDAHVTAVNKLVKVIHNWGISGIKHNVEFVFIYADRTLWLLLYTVACLAGYIHSAALGACSLISCNVNCQWRHKLWRDVRWQRQNRISLTDTQGTVKTVWLNVVQEGHLAFCRNNCFFIYCCVVDARFQFNLDVANRWNKLNDY